MTKELKESWLDLEDFCRSSADLNVFQYYQNLAGFNMITELFAGLGS